MGLENGIIIKTKAPVDTTGAKKYIQHRFKSSQDLFWEESEKGKYIYEAIYWRKCWDFRSIVASHTDFVDGGNTSLTTKDLRNIRKDLKKFKDEYYYDNHNCSIWDYEDRIDSLKADIKTLKFLYKYAETHPEDIISIEFYDSY